jgi:hypothetical protein
MPSNSKRIKEILDRLGKIKEILRRNVDPKKKAPAIKEREELKKELQKLGYTGKLYSSLGAVARLQEIAATKQEWETVYNATFKVMLKHGQRYLARAKWYYENDYSEVIIAFETDMDDVPESLLNELKSCNTKNVRVDPCRSIHGSGFTRYR